MVRFVYEVMSFFFVIILPAPSTVPDTQQVLNKYMLNIWAAILN